MAIAFDIFPACHAAGWRYPVLSPRPRNKCGATGGVQGSCHHVDGEAVAQVLHQHPQVPAQLLLQWILA